MFKLRNFNVKFPVPEKKYAHSWEDLDGIPLTFAQYRRIIEVVSESKTIRELRDDHLSSTLQNALDVYEGIVEHAFDTTVSGGSKIRFFMKYISDNQPVKKASIPILDGTYCGMQFIEDGRVVRGIVRSEYVITIDGIDRFHDNVEQTMDKFPPFKWYHRVVFVADNSTAQMTLLKTNITKLILKGDKEKLERRIVDHFRSFCNLKSRTEITRDYILKKQKEVYSRSMLAGYVPMQRFTKEEKAVLARKLRKTLNETKAMSWLMYGDYQYVGIIPEWI